MTAWAQEIRVFAFIKYPEPSYSEKRCKIHIITVAEFAVVLRKHSESSMKNITHAYL